MRQSSQMLPLHAIILASMSLVMVVSSAMREVTTEDKCKCLMCVCDVDPHPLPPAVPVRHPPPSEPEPEPIPTPKYYPPPSEPVYYPPSTKPEPTPVYYTPPSEPEPTPVYYYTPPAVPYGYPWGDTYGTPGQLYPQYYPSSAHQSLCRGISSQLLAYLMLAAAVLSLLTCRP